MKALGSADHSYSSGQGLLIGAGILLFGIGLGVGLRAWGRSRTAPA